LGAAEAIKNVFNRLFQKGDFMAFGVLLEAFRVLLEGSQSFLKKVL
jgi:hypothetical protein